jgi:hypothetical protein
LGKHLGSCAEVAHPHAFEVLAFEVLAFGVEQPHKWYDTALAGLDGPRLAIVPSL